MSGEELRAALEDLLRVAFRGEDFLTQNSVPMAATPGVRRALRKVRAALAAPSTPEPSGLDMRICRLHGVPQDDPAHEYRYPDCERAGFYPEGGAPSTEPALDVERLERALRATGALWSANDYYEATTDADEFARAIAAEYARLAESQP